MIPFLLLTGRVSGGWAAGEALQKENKRNTLNFKELAGFMMQGTEMDVIKNYSQVPQRQLTCLMWTTTRYFDVSAVEIKQGK